MEVTEKINEILSLEIAFDLKLCTSSTVRATAPIMDQNYIAIPKHLTGTNTLCIVEFFPKKQLKYDLVMTLDIPQKTTFENALSKSNKFSIINKESRFVFQREILSTLTKFSNKSRLSS